jgi:translation initiation factor IF-2
MESKSSGSVLAPPGHKTTAQVNEPIRIKEFCSAVGIPFIRLMRTLQREHNMAVVSINTLLPNDVAELVALEEGITLEIIRPKTALDLLQEEIEQREPNNLGPRPPVVTLLGHVDHGKTSLLDAIRNTRVAKSEDGGITQHIGSYHLERDGVSVTFLDTPGHEAFTAMRARGAQLTDIVVLVVAADDGIMPQTVEAINHAKAAGVPIVVAITKMDLGSFDENRVYGQLAGHELTPIGDWGGEVDVIKTSALTGDGIDELLEHLSALGEALGLQASHGGDPVGTVIEAETKEGVGPVAKVLVHSGKLRPGTMLCCGNAYGKVRALLDDHGKRLTEVGPSMPAEVWGLDEVPSAGDRLYGLSSPQRAKLIAEEVRQARRSKSWIGTQKARTLEDVFKQRGAAGIPQLEVIIRGDVHGTVDALRHCLGQLPSDQVKLMIRHAGVGAVTDGDVLLADTSNAIIIAFRVVAGAATRKLADEHGVEIREYKVIYDVVDDLTTALEGLLEPEEKLELRASAEVRGVFKVSKVGAVAGCYVTEGTLRRDHVVRLVREGVVLRENCRIASLRRFKDDAKEIRQGLECGVRLERFDDVKEGDVLEAYEVVKVARTL